MLILLFFYTKNNILYQGALICRKLKHSFYPPKLLQQTSEEAKVLIVCQAQY